jgi:hypothetical protein
MFPELRRAYRDGALVRTALEYGLGYAGATLLFGLVGAALAGVRVADAAFVLALPGAALAFLALNGSDLTHPADVEGETLPVGWRLLSYGLGLFCLGWLVALLAGVSGL